MKIVVVGRCYNEEKNIERFIRGYSFADKIIISDGGSTDNSINIIKKYENYKIKLIHFDKHVILNGEYFNLDNPHLNYVINAGKEENPEFLILDDMDCVPNQLLRENAREIIEKASRPQLNVFRLYMWGDDQYFPLMNNYFDPNFKSFWAWNPKEVNIHADESMHHGTFRGMIGDYQPIELPMCLLHKSWYPHTIEAKIKRYNKVGIEMRHPLDFAGKPELLPEYAHE